MPRWKLLSAATLLAAALPLATATTSHAQGWGPCTPPGNSAVGAAGPAMNGGQLMAGVGQCRRIGGWDNSYDYWNGYWNPGYRRPAPWRPGPRYYVRHY